MDLDKSSIIVFVLCVLNTVIVHSDYGCSSNQTRKAECKTEENSNLYHQNGNSSIAGHKKVYGYGYPLPMNEFMEGGLTQTEKNGLSALDEKDDRDDRFIFTVIRFHNGPCNGSGGNSGVCRTRRECDNIGGSVIGSCARGFGSCCYKEVTCGGTASSNCTYLVSPGYPGSYNEARSCSISFTRTSDVCQLRLDFTEFTSAQPDQFGVCNDDQFTVPGERKFTYLCGDAPPNWHFYLDVNGKQNPTVFNFDTSTTSFDRRFKIKVSMIRCKQKVPCGCGQYHTGNTGTYTSFNYGSGPYLAGLDYGICFRKEKNMCTTTLTTLGYSFTSCPDLYRLPVGESNGNTLPVFNTNNLYCQLNAVTNPFFQSVNRVPSPISSVTNGPLTIWHMTLIDNNPNFLSNDNCPTCAGFNQMWTHNAC